MGTDVSLKLVAEGYLGLAKTYLTAAKRTAESITDEHMREKMLSKIREIGNPSSNERATFIELLNLAEHFLAERQPESDERALRKRIADALTRAPMVTCQRCEESREMLTE